MKIETVLLGLIEAAEQRAEELQREIPHADDRGAEIIEREMEKWHKLAREGREAISRC